jgi:large subunit ribosomal protein L31e
MERIYVIPLRKVKEAPRTVRAPKAVRVVKEFLEKHMKSEEIKLDASVNEKLWERGIQKIPPKIKVKAVKDEDGSVAVTLAE